MQVAFEIGKLGNPVSHEKPNNFIEQPANNRSFKGNIEKASGFPMEEYTINDLIINSTDDLARQGLDKTLQKGVEHQEKNS